MKHPNAIRLRQHLSTQPVAYLLCSLRYLICLLTLPYLIAGQYALANEPKKITFSCWISAELPAFVAMEALYRESFAAIGYEFSMIHQPPVRSLAAANQGTTDGECARVASYLQLAPDSPLERVNVMVAKTNLGVWSYDNNIKFNGPLSLLNPRYKIAYGRGTAAMQLFLLLYPLKNLQAVNSIAVGIKMLARKRFDILIAPEAIFNQELTHNPADVALYKVGTLMVLEGYPYIHKRHHDIISAFTTELQKRTPIDGLPLP